MDMKTLKLGQTLNIFFAASIIMPLIIISSFAMYYSTSFLNELSKNNNIQIAENLKVSVESFFIEPQNDLNILRDILANLQNRNEDLMSFNELFMIFHVNQEQFHHYQVVNSDGIVSYSYPDREGNVGFDFSNTQYFKAIKNGADSYWSETYVDTRFGQVSIDYALPINGRILVGTIQLEKLKNIFDSIVDDQGFDVGITDSTGVYIAHTDYSNVEQRFTDPYVNQRSLNYDLVSINNVSHYGTIIESAYQGWNIVLYEHISKQGEKVNRFLILLTLIIVVSATAVIVLGNRLNNRIIKNLTEVVNNTKNIASGDYGISIKPGQFFEFDEIGNHFSLMAEKIMSRENQIIEQKNKIGDMNRDLELRVLERTDELQTANEKLELTLKNLEETKEQLIESEKLASLGNLVAGLAHEINTPLGIILTVITYMQDNTEKFNSKYTEGRLKRDDLTKFIESLTESETLIFDNVIRTTDLLSSFKLISTDQMSNETRRIDLSSYVENIVRGLEPNLKKSKIGVRLDLESDIEIITIPGSIYQVVVNLVMNAALHGYGDLGGTIDISVRSQGDQAEIIIEDYGDGISKENLKHIFEPFLTTTRGSGGTGLGLNITYNAIRKSLKGFITVDSQVGVGTRVHVQLPMSIVV